MASPPSHERSNVSPLTLSHQHPLTLVLAALARACKGVTPNSLSHQYTLTRFLAARKIVNERAKDLRVRVPRLYQLRAQGRHAVGMLRPRCRCLGRPRQGYLRTVRKRGQR